MVNLFPSLLFLSMDKLHSCRLEKVRCDCLVFMYNKIPLVIESLAHSHCLFPMETIISHFVGMCLPHVSVTYCSITHHHKSTVVSFILSRFCGLVMQLNDSFAGLSHVSGELVGELGCLDYRGLP